MDLISSNQNSLMKEVKSLKLKKNRDEKQLFFIEGSRFVEEALKENVDILYAMTSEKFFQSKENKSICSTILSKGHKLHLLTEKLYKDISDTENPQGIMAVIRMKKYSLPDVLKKNGNFVVVLDCVQDPGNMGTIIRTADAAGANGIIVSKGCVDLYNPKVLRSTMGSIFHIPIHFSENIVNTLTQLKGEGLQVYASHLKGDTNFYGVGSWENCAIIIGNEARGMSDDIASLADILVKIPMAGRAESLNASIAAGLLMYEVLRNRLS